MATLDLQALKDAIDDCTQATRAAYFRVRDLAAKASDALKLGGKDGAQTRTDAGAAFRTHVASRANPHVVTATQLGSPTRTELDAVIAGLVPSGILPISIMGMMEAGTEFASISSAWQFQIARADTVMVGKRWTAPLKTFNLSTLYPTAGDRQNKTFFLYLQLTEGRVEYSISAIRLSETLGRMFIGAVVTSASAITSVSVKHRWRLDLYNCLQNPTGMSMPASSGQAGGTGTLAAGWKN